MKSKYIIIDPATANEIYDVLVSECGAWEGQRDSFVAYATRQKKKRREGYSAGEYRFGGRLDHGGKFHFDQWGWRATCYPEHMTPARQEMLRRANDRLMSLRDKTPENGFRG